VLEAAANCQPAFPAEVASDKVRRAYQQYAPGSHSHRSQPFRGIRTIDGREACRWLS